MDDRFDLERFVEAQGGVYDVALGELRAGRKRSHWMWFVFPQLAGLGSSAMAQAYAIRSLQEARAYLTHPVLGRRLVECVEAVNAVRERSAGDVFGYPDELKFRSSLTLFLLAAASEAKAPFQRALDRYFDGQGDPQTIQALGRQT
ncbi:MAG: DUF1810 domain-containing protein [Caulobacteraceae bacterium]